MHRPDMPVLPNGPFVGLGLWNWVPATVAAKASVYLIGMVIAIPAVRATIPE